MSTVQEIARQLATTIEDERVLVVRQAIQERLGLPTVPTVHDIREFGESGRLRKYAERTDGAQWFMFDDKPLVYVGPGRVKIDGQGTRQHVVRGTFERGPWTYESLGADTVALQARATP
jgi:hypothetical protein